MNTAERRQKERSQNIQFNNIIIIIKCYFDNKLLIISNKSMYHFYSIKTFNQHIVSIWSYMVAFLIWCTPLRLCISTYI